jgi:hypothetical protein
MSSAAKLLLAGLLASLLCTVNCAQAQIVALGASDVAGRGVASDPNLTFGTRPDQRLSGRNRPEATIQDGWVHAEMSG